MNASLIVTLIGADRPGLVSALAARAAAEGANWLESSMAQLAGRFAGVVRLEIPQSRVAALEASLRALELEGLRVTIEHGATEPAAAAQTLKLSLLGHDRPGIVRDISAALARQGASISKLETRCENASFSGEQLFRADMEITAPRDLNGPSLRSALEALANELMVDLTMEGGAGSTAP
ncbi:MAG: glycine cleavage system protein R [Rhodoferax sp.]|nr:glycine cleavage system protein R [Rhodoferax sp.]